jgi:aldehyde:ferredoxin oxidoreductase
VTLGGWTGTVLRVDLTHGSVRTEPLPESWARDYVGGRGVAARYLHEEADPGVDPLSPANPLIFATGPLTGTNASCGARYMVVTKGPLTGCMTTSNSGGHWGPELKFAGYDLLILEGRAAEPVYLWILDDTVELRPAAHLWGRGVFDTEDEIRRETGMPDRAAGRSGVGAVMGSKRLKAIAVRGTQGVRVARPAEMMAAQWSMKHGLTQAPLTAEGLPQYGTLALMNVINEHGALPTNNYQQAQFDQAEAISGEELAATRLETNKACFACTIACGRVSRISDEGAGRYTMVTSPRNWKHATEGPEYENAWSLGADCGISDLDAILKSNTLCNDYGLDPISFGATLAAAMELYEKGVLTDEQTGMPLRFGSGDALVAMTEKTAFREGFGDVLALGSKRMGAKLGHPEVFMGVKGQEFPAYDPRAIQGMGLGYATSNRGACHLRAYTVAAEIVGNPEPLDPPATCAPTRWRRRSSATPSPSTPARPRARPSSRATSRTSRRRWTPPDCVSSSPSGSGSRRSRRSSPLPRAPSAPRTTSCAPASASGTSSACGTCARARRQRTTRYRSGCSRIPFPPALPPDR